MYEEYFPQKASQAAFPVGMAEPHLFCDYGFDPEIDYFQLQQKVIEEQQRRKRGNGRREARKAATEAVRFKLQKPISKDHSSSSSGTKGKKRAKWWKNCIQFLKNKWTATRTEQDPSSSDAKEPRICYDGPPPPTIAPAALPPPPTHTPTPPLYTTDGSSMYRAPCRTTKRRFGSWTWSPLKVAEVPYHCLSDLGLFDDDNQGKKDHHRLSDPPSSHMPIYLVT